MQFLTRCVRCGVSVRRGTVTCPACGESAQVSALSEAPSGERRGKERLTWGVMLGTGLQHLGYGLGGIAVLDGLLLVLLYRKVQGLIWLSMLTGFALICIFAGGWMRENLQGPPSASFRWMARFLFRYYRVEYTATPAGICAVYAFLMWISFRADDPLTVMAVRACLGLTLVSVLLQWMKDAIADDP